MTPFTLPLLLLLKFAEPSGAEEPSLLSRLIGSRYLPCDYVRAAGFICQTHQILSAGAPLTLYRIINPLANPATLNRFPVLYGHGLVLDSGTMLSRSENSRPRKPNLGEPTVKYPNPPADLTDDYSLPFMMSNNNFDVWLYDARGANSNSRNVSVQLNPFKAAPFWDFSLDDESLIDLPNLMQYVLNRTVAEKIVYVGYSQSTLFVFALLSEYPHLSDKFAAIVCLAPVAYAGHVKGLGIPLVGINAFMPRVISYNIPQPVLTLADAALRNLCKIKPLSSLICGSLDKSVGGNGRGEFAPEMFREFFKSTSIKVARHFLQLYLFNRFAKYDYGPIRNLIHYGTLHPPSYNLTRIKSDRIILVRGTADILSHPEDQKRLLKELGTKPFKDINIEKYNHFDFVDGKDLIREANEPIIKAVFELMQRDGPSPHRTMQQYEAIQRYETTHPIKGPSKGNEHDVGGVIGKVESLANRATKLLTNLVP